MVESLLQDVDVGGGDDRLQIRCTEDVKQEWREMCVDLDGDATYEEVLVACIRVYHEHPDRFERMLF